MMGCISQCDVLISCSCCNVQFSCLCALHIHFCKEKRVIKYLINVGSFKAEIIAQKCLPDDSSFETVDCTQHNVNAEINHDTEVTDTTRSQNVDRSILLSSKACENTCMEMHALSDSRENACTSVIVAGDDISDEVTACLDEQSTEVDDEASNIADNTDADKNSNELDVSVAKEAMKSRAQKRRPVRSSNFQVPCDICGYLFKRRNLTRHMQSHASTKNFTCEVCNKVFRTVSSLHCHKLHHKVEKTFLCNFCGKLFNNGPNLRQHVKSHTREKNLKCPLCQKKFRSNFVLKDHLSRHSDERPHSCEVCSRSFRKAQELKRHMTAHSETRNHPCLTCNKRFKSKSNLIKHEKIHYKKEHSQKLNKSTSVLRHDKL